MCLSKKLSSSTIIDLDCKKTLIRKVSKTYTSSQNHEEIFGFFLLCEFIAVTFFNGIENMLSLRQTQIMCFLTNFRYKRFILTFSDFVAYVVYGMNPLESKALTQKQMER